MNRFEVNMTNDNQTLIDGQNKSAIDAGTVGGGLNGNGSGLPHGNQSVSGAASVGLMPEKFGGNGFKTWQQKMQFFLTNLNLNKCLKEDPPILPSENTDPMVFASVDSWNHSDFVCKGWILSRLIDPLYAVYCEVKTSKQLWTALAKKYKSEDAGCQKYATAKFHNFKMVDSKPIMEQVEAFQLITHEIAAEGMSICEIFTVNSFIEKLPPSWLDFKNYLTHKRKAISLEDLIVKLRVESRNREADAVLIRKNDVNLAEHKNKGKGKVPPKSTTSFKKPMEHVKFTGTCRKCGKVGHKAHVCRSKAGSSYDKGKSQANLTEDDMCAVVTEVNNVEDNPRTWWYDTGATIHVCIDKDMFSTYQKCNGEERLLMGNTGSSKIEGKGEVKLQMTSGKEITLKNVKHVPGMRKNLISGSLLSKAGFAITFDSDNVVLEKHGVYLGKGFVQDGLVKMCVKTVLP